MARLHQFFIKSDKLVGCSTEYIKKELINVTNSFWIDVFQSWIKYNEKLAVDDEFILKSPIFYNKNILIGGQIIYYYKWFKNGVRFINDLVKDNGEFFSYQDFLERARVQTSFLQYVGTIQAIKTCIKKKTIDIIKKISEPFYTCSLFQHNKNNKRPRLCMIY